MFAQALRQLHDTLNQKADTLQREFIAVSEELKLMPRRIQDALPEERDPLLARLEALHAEQLALAQEVNLWRERARAATRQPGEDALRAYLGELKALDDGLVSAAAGRALFVMDAPEEELTKLVAEASTKVVRPTTPAGRLIERASMEFDLRGVDPRPRKAAAVEFANRPGMLANDEALAELEAALNHADPLVREVVTLTVIQIHRLRALRLAELEAGHASAKRLRQINDPAVVAVFIEILQTPRTGFVAGENGPVEATNQRTRRVALGGLVEWHTAEAQQALRQCQFDRDPEIVKLAEVALEMFPGEWNGPTPETRRARSEVEAHVNH